MVVNTAIGFLFSGSGLLAATAPGKVARHVATLVAILIMILAFEELAVLFFDLSPALSLPELHRPLQPDYPHPGRMAPNTALCFFLFGSFLILQARSVAGWAAGVAKWCATAVGSIGLLGVIGYSLRLEFLYDWSGVVRMAVHTGIGMVVLGWGAWSLLEARHPLLLLTAGGEVEGVKRTATFLLVLVAASAGIGGFAFLQGQVEKEASDDLLHMTQARIELFDQVIWHRLGRAKVVSQGVDLSGRLRDLAQAPDKAGTLERQREWASRLAENGFSSVIAEVAGRRWQLLGRPLTASLSVPLQQADPALLMWKEGYVLRVDAPVHDSAGIVGRLITEQPLDALTAMSAAGNRVGGTAELAVCAPGAGGLQCFPLRSRPAPFTIPRAIGSQRLPMDYALRGSTGTRVAFDYRGHRVLAGYGPIGGTGLGMVVKRDIAEIYAPIRVQFQRIVAFLAALLLAGHWVLRRRLRPLLLAMEVSRADAVAESARFEAAVESNLDAFFILESVRDKSRHLVDLRYSLINARAEDILDRPREQVIGRGLCEISPEHRESGFFANLVRVVETGEPLVEERESVVRKSRWYHMQAVRLGDGVGLTVRDVTAARQDADRILHQATHDPLTGLANRQGFEAALTQAIIEATSTGQMSVLALLDLDDFKPVNDTLGHAAGDLLLQEVARRLQDSLRPSDFVARLGGDEFVLILPSVGYRVGVEKLARKLVAAVARPMMLDGHEAKVSASLGITLFPLGGEDATALLRQADEAMYQAKNAGRNGYVVFDRDAPKP